MLFFVRTFAFFILILSPFVLLAQESSPSYAWKGDRVANENLKSALAPPPGFERVYVSEGSFGHWLRHFPVSAKQDQVLLYDGRPKFNQKAHALILDIDTGNRDLQQCADAVMRLKGEYHFSKGEYDKIIFNFTSGDPVPYSRWRRGERVKVNGNKISWQSSAAADPSYKQFRRYMNLIFSYAGTYSLEKEMKRVKEAKDLMPGDVFIQGGFPGHAMIVMDVVQHPETCEKLFLLAQSYMPAQDLHIVKNPHDPQLSPWYQIPTQKLQSPEWQFLITDLKRF